MADLRQVASSTPAHPETFSVGGILSFTYDGVVTQFTVRSVKKRRAGQTGEGVTLQLVGGASHDEAMSVQSKSGVLKFSTCQILATDYKHTRAPSEHAPPYSKSEWFDEVIDFITIQENEISPKLTNGQICEDLIKCGIRFDLHREVLGAADLKPVVEQSEQVLYQNHSSLVYVGPCVMYFTQLV